MPRTLPAFCLAPILLALLLGACTDPPPDPPLPQPTLSPQPVSNDWYTLYFTDPDDPQAGSFRRGPDQAVAEAIDAARLSVDAALFDLNLWSIRDALLDANRRGVEVRIVTETDNLDEPETQELIEAGLMVVDDQGEGLMHNKFILIDQREVWTGSMNFTTTDAYFNNNNLLHLRASRLAQSYTAEFDEMFAQGQFGAGRISPAASQDIRVDGVRVEVYFSPEDNTATRLVELIEDATDSINFLAFSFTSDAIADALLDAAARGVAVSGVFEQSQYNSNIGSEYDRLLDAGLEVYLDGNPRNMHHKVIIIDQEIVITGSYNFSASAEERNDENTLILHSPIAAQAYLQEFQNILSQAQK